MRRSTAAIALIRSDSNGQNLWLAQWNARWNAYHFVGGHKRATETFRDCLLREVAEELKLVYQSDYHAPKKPCRSVEHRAWSHRTKAETHYVMKLFHVKLAPCALFKVASNLGNRWLIEAEIEAGQTRDGQSVSPTMKRLLWAFLRRP
jgi:ADP-ribose pyrophosphatase YjhB (NUDIX family)